MATRSACFSFILRFFLETGVAVLSSWLFMVSKLLALVPPFHHDIRNITYCIQWKFAWFHFSIRSQPHFKRNLQTCICSNFVVLNVFDFSKLQRLVVRISTLFVLTWLPSTFLEDEPIMWFMAVRRLQLNSQFVNSFAVASHRQFRSLDRRIMMASVTSIYNSYCQLNPALKFQIVCHHL